MIIRDSEEVLEGLGHPVDGLIILFPNNKVLVGERFRLLELNPKIELSLGVDNHSHVDESGNDDIVLEMKEDVLLHEIFGVLVLHELINVLLVSFLEPERDELLQRSRH